MPRKNKKRTVRINKRQKKLAKLIAQGLTTTDAGKRAGYRTRQAASNAHKRIKLRFYPALEAAGYNVDKEVTTIYSKIREKMECKETVFFQNEGRVVEMRDVIPHKIQLRAAVELARLLGAVGSDHDDEPNPVGLRPGHISVKVALPPGVDPGVLMAIGAGTSGDQPPSLDVEAHKDKRGHPGPEL
jgi:hypothetical protein